MTPTPPIFFQRNKLMLNIERIKYLLILKIAMLPPQLETENTQ